MPKSSVAFWTRKFTENMERDRRTERELEKLGWRVMVVWECELANHTLDVFKKIASWLIRGSAAGDEFHYDEHVLDRGKLLAIAEEKVRYRIGSYDKESDFNEAQEAEVRKP
jgi:hypothetical protein